MREQTIARRYARAIVEIGRKHELLNEMESELLAFVQLLQVSDSDFQKVMLNPAFRISERLSVMGKLCDLRKTPDVVRRILEMLVEKDRFRYLPEIYGAFLRELDARLGRVRATITSAVALQPTELQHVVDGLAARVGKSVVAESAVDASVIGGLRAQIGGLMFDGTVQAKLGRLERSLITAAAI